MAKIAATTLLTGILVSSALLDAHSQELAAGETPATVLAPVVVTATRNPEPLSDTPNSVAVLDASEIREDLPRTLPEALEEIPGVLVQKTAHGQGSPFIRGFTAFRNLLLIDGIRVNHAAFREGPNQYWATVDPYTASQIELVRGQGSVLYGSDAIG